MPRNISVLVCSNCSGWRWMLSIVEPIRYPMPAPAPMTPAPAAMPTPTSLSSCWSSANNIPTCSAGSADNSIYPAPLYSLFSQPSVHFIGKHCQLYIDLGEYSEYVSLNYRDKDLKRVEHHGHGHGDERHDGAEVQDKAEEDEDDQVPRQDVGVKPQSQRERLGNTLLDKSNRD